MMTLRQIRHFIAVAETGSGSVSVAAQAVYISQSTLTLAIQQLELEIGVSLFNRHAKGMTLTHQGHHSGAGFYYQPTLLTGQRNAHGGLQRSGYGKDLSSDSLQDYSVVRHIMARHGQHL